MVAPSREPVRAVAGRRGPRAVSVHALRELGRAAVHGRRGAPAPPAGALPPRLSLVSERSPEDAVRTDAGRLGVRGGRRDPGAPYGARRAWAGEPDRRRRRAGRRRRAAGCPGGRRQRTRPVRDRRPARPPARRRAPAASLAGAPAVLVLARAPDDRRGRRGLVARRTGARADPLGHVRADRTSRRSRSCSGCSAPGSPARRSASSSSSSRPILLPSTSRRRWPARSGTHR